MKTHKIMRSKAALYVIDKLAYPVLWIVLKTANWLFNQSRYLYRAALFEMKGILPEKVRTRKDKQGFLTADRSWVMRDHTDYFREKIKEAVQVTNGILRPEALTYFDRIVTGRLPFRYAYLRFIILSEWIKLFNVK